MANTVIGRKIGKKIDEVAKGTPKTTVSQVSSYATRRASIDSKAIPKPAAAPAPAPAPKPTPAPAAPAPFVTQKETVSPSLNLVSANETTSADPIQRRYAAMQENLKAQEGSAAQAEQTALQRRFASMGALNSGAALKNSQLQADTSNRRLAEARNALMAAQAGDEQTAFEQAAGRNLQREGMRSSLSDSMLGRNLQRESMDAQSRESGLTRDFQGSQAALDRSFTGNQNELNRDLDWRKTDAGLNLQRDQLNETVRQFEKEFPINVDVVEFNKQIAREMLKNPSMFENIFGKDAFGKGITWSKPLGNGAGDGANGFFNWLF